MAEPEKKMSLVQLTVLVAVNMMGSGIIMLPTNMAKVGAISLLSWIVTAVGSMAIAYGFAQAGLLNQRSGGMSAYAEDAYGKSGFFIVFYLYFFSLAIGNVAIAISAVGYLATFFAWLSSTPIATCIGVIALIWLTTVANFGGPKVTGRIGSITVWGVIIPVAGLSLIGWFWFSRATFAEARSRAWGRASRSPSGPSSAWSRRRRTRARSRTRSGTCRWRACSARSAPR
jgi:putrescine:ornithine antiporter